MSRRVETVRVWILGLVVGPALAGCASTTTGPLLTEPQRLRSLESFDVVWTKIHDEYWDPTFNGVNWAGVREELRPRMERVSTMTKARAILRDMISRLKLSHFAIIPAEVYREPEQPAEADRQEGETGMEARVIDGHLLVASVVKGFPAERLGVRAGWEIVRIGEIDIVARLHELERALPDTPSKRVRLVNRAVAGWRQRAAESVAVTFLDGEDNRIELDIPFAKPRGRANRLGNLGEIRVWIDVRTIDEDIGYVAFNGFFKPPYLMVVYNDAMRSFADAEGVIIDLRGNGGGMGAMAMGMAGWLVDENRSFGTLHMRDNELKMIVHARPGAYAGPVVVLVDGLSGSASEFFAGGLQAWGRACVVGSRTKGEALPGQFTTLPNGDVFLYATANFVMAGGNTLEGVGVIPDIEVSPTREALLADRDLALEAAVNWIRSQGSPDQGSD